MRILHDWQANAKGWVRLLPPPHLEQTHGVIEPLERCLPTAAEQGIPRRDMWELAKEL